MQENECKHAATKEQLLEVQSDVKAFCAELHATREDKSNGDRRLVEMLAEFNRDRLASEARIAKLAADIGAQNIKMERMQKQIGIPICCLPHTCCVSSALIWTCIDASVLVDDAVLDD